MVCSNICEKIYSKIIVGQSHYSVGKRYCIRREIFFIMRVSLSVLRNATQDYFRKIKKTIAKTGDDSRVSLLNINILYL